MYLSTINGFWWGWGLGRTQFSLPFSTNLSTYSLYIPIRVHLLLVPLTAPPPLPPSLLRKPVTTTMAHLVTAELDMSSPIEGREGSQIGEQNPQTSNGDKVSPQSTCSRTHMKNKPHICSAWARQRGRGSSPYVLFGWWSLAGHSLSPCSSLSTWFSSRGWSLGVRPCSRDYMGNTKWSWVFWGFFRGRKSWRWRTDVGRLERECDGECDMKFLNNQ